MNSVNIVGRLGKDPQTFTSAGGTSVTKFSLGVDVGYGDNKKTLWVDITTFKKTADVVQNYLSKGSQVAVTGYLQPESWTDKQTGQPRTKISIVANEITLIGSKEARETVPAGRESGDEDFESGF